ncbi:unnamed protein product [Strongylus vulgaris]|uniref:Uncharacterized protein n=1 Tax=Strongylus vulgaris TaxID=40348 RepID=A0A3P7LMG0_STRVU|nr:unnamed protein product [Strongylus vulgaris]
MPRRNLVPTNPIVFREICGMDESVDPDESGARRSYPSGAVDDEEKFIPFFMARRTLLSCNHYRSPSSQLLELGSINVGKCQSIEAAMVGKSKQIYIESPLPEDNLIWVSVRTEVGQKQKVKDMDITHRVGEVRNLVRGGHNRCANAVLGLLYPQFAKTLKKQSSLWAEAPVGGQRENFDEFFTAIRERRKNPPTYELKLDGLSTTLLPFQKDAVNFMIHKELFAPVDRGDLLKTIILPEHNDIQYFPCLGLFVRCKCDHISFVDDVQGEFAKLLWRYMFDFVGL